MNSNKFLKFLCSIPVILIFLYFIPFLGICLTLFRFYVYKNNKYYSTSIILILIGALLLMPKAINLLLDLINLNVAIPYLNDIVNADIYANIIKYSKLLLSFGIILLIVSIIFRNLFNKITNKLSSGIGSYINKIEQRDAEISRKNDMIMKEKQEKAKNTHVVNCPKCGADNIFSQKIGRCKYCRTKLEYTENK